MKNKPLEDGSELLISLYALSQEQPIEHFHNAALLLLKTIVTFDAAIWGVATTKAEGIDIHSFHLHNKTPDMVVDYEEVKRLDSASAGMLGTPRATQAFNAVACFSDPARRPIRDFMMKFAQPNFLLSTDLNSSMSLLHWLTLYRTKGDAHFKAADVQQLHLFAPHFRQALALNRALHLSKSVSSEEKNSRIGTAIADPTGCVHANDDLFKTIIGNACGHPDAVGYRLPYDLVAKIAGEGSDTFHWQRLVVQCREEHGLIVIKVRAQTLVDSLTAREKIIASLVSKGFTYKQVAAELCRSPATVRNQIQGIYGKLQVSKIAELVQALSDSR